MVSFLQIDFQSVKWVSHLFFAFSEMEKSYVVIAASVLFFIPLFHEGLAIAARTKDGSEERGYVQVRRKAHMFWWYYRSPYRVEDPNKPWPIILWLQGGPANMRILVTGGAGFIASHLVDRLMQNEKNKVIVVDNCFTGSKDNLKQWIGHPRFELIRHDVTEPLLVEVDQIYHLACPASPIFYNYNPIKVILKD